MPLLLPEEDGSGERYLDISNRKSDMVFTDGDVHAPRRGSFFPWVFGLLFSRALVLEYFQKLISLLTICYVSPLSFLGLKRLEATTKTVMGHYRQQNRSCEATSLSSACSRGRHRYYEGVVPHRDSGGWPPSSIQKHASNCQDSPHEHPKSNTEVSRRIMGRSFLLTASLQFHDQPGPSCPGSHG